MAAQVAMHRPHQSRHAPLGPLNMAAVPRHPHFSTPNGQVKLKAGSLSRGPGLQASGRGLPSNKAMAAQTMDVRSIGSLKAPLDRDRTPSSDLASAANRSSAAARQRQPGGAGSVPDYGNPIIADYRRKVANAFGFTFVNGVRRPLTKPEEIEGQYAAFEEARECLPASNMVKLHARDILLARRRYLLVQLEKSAQMAKASKNAGRPVQADGRPARPTARSSSSSGTSWQSSSDPMHDSSWTVYCKTIEDAFLKAIKNHGKAHKGCTYDGELPCEEWLDIMQDCGGQPSHQDYEEHAQAHPHCSLEGSRSCAAWLQWSRELRESLQGQVETLYVAEQDIQRARACIFAICRNAGMLPFIRDYNRKLKAKKYLCRDGSQRRITLDREELNGWREEIENIIAIAYKHKKSIDAALAEFQGRTVWRQLGEPERQYLKRYFKLNPKTCRIHEEPSEYLAPSGSTRAPSSAVSSSAQTYAWTAMGVPEDQQDALRAVLAERAAIQKERIQKERKKKLKMKQWINKTNLNVPEVQAAMVHPKDTAMPAAIAQTLQHMQTWEKHRKDVVPPMPSRNDAPSSASSSSSSRSSGSSSDRSGSRSGSGSRTGGTPSGSSTTSRSKKSDRGEYNQLASVALGEDHINPGGIVNEYLEDLNEYKNDDYDDDEGYDDEEYDGEEFDGGDTEALFEEMRQSRQPQRPRMSGKHEQLPMAPRYDDGYGSMSSATDVTSGDTGAAYQEAGQRYPTGRSRKR